MTEEKKQCLLETTDGKGHIYMLPFPDTDKYRKYFMELKLEECPVIKIYGKECHQRRNVSFFSDASIGYKYSGALAKSSPLSDEMKEIMNYINTLFNDNYNGILINHYVDGEDYISNHSDNETSLGNSGVVGIVFGATRKFRIKDKNGKTVKDLLIPDGHIYHMDQEFNKQYTHGIPVEKRVKDARVSLTFRHHKY